MRFIPTAVSSRVALAALKVSKHSPTLLFGAGVVGVVGSAVLASRATLKVEGILDDHQILADQIKTAIDFDEYTDKDRVKDLALLYTQTTIKITKLYGPALIVGGLSVAALTGSHRILTKRNAALTATYAVVEKAFKEYRGRVVEDLGEAKDREYLEGRVIEKTAVPTADGKSTKLETQKYRTGVSPYGVIWHEGNPNWTDRPDWNLMWLRGIQNQLNDKLTARGYLFLSDVLDDLGFEQTKASRVVGWIKKGGGDGFVDFGLFDDAAALRVGEYVTGKEGELFLDFNVDGVIFDKI